MTSKFEWIDVSQNPDGDNKKKNQRKVRAHAMRATAALRKQSPTWGQRNLRQLPPDLSGAANDDEGGPSVSTSSGSPSTDAPRRTKSGRGTSSGINRSEAPDFSLSDSGSGSGSEFGIGVGVGNNCCSLGSVLRRPNAYYSAPPPPPPLVRPMPLAGLALLSAETGVDILDLSALTEVQCGRVASSLIAAQPRRMGDLVARRRPSYLSFVPARYGRGSCLDDAVRCVATRARRVLAPSPGRREAPGRAELLQYGAALRSLQSAVDDAAGAWKSPDVLCAVQLLGLFEIMHSSHGLGWSQHISGASRLVRLRGPGGFSSDFEKSLLLACTSPLVYECLVKGEACYLEEEPWQELLRSFATSERPFSPRGKLNIAMSCILARVPGLLRDLDVAVSEQDSIADDADLEPLRSRMRQLRADLLQWRAEYDSALLRATAAAAACGSATPASPPDSEDLRAELLGTCYGLSALAARMLGAVCMESVAALEDEAAGQARQMLRLEGEVALANARAAFYLGQKLGIINALLATTWAWRRRPEGPGRRVASQRQFRSWACLIPGRQQAAEALPLS